MWVARDKDGTLMLYGNKPDRLASCWYSNEHLPDYAKYNYDKNYDNLTKEEQDCIDDLMLLDESDELIYNEYVCKIDINLFPNLKWEDEPLEVSLKSNKKIDNELNAMFCQLCVDYNISDEVADEFIKTFKKNICG